jgi:glycerol-3-phosphate acyltransferase PlsY
MSVGSIAGAVTLALIATVGDAPGIVSGGAAASAVIIIHRHRGNLARLVAGTERRIGQRVVNETAR